VREARWAIGPTRSSRLGGASAISFKRYSALGRPPWRRAVQLRGDRKQAALKDQRFEPTMELGRCGERC